jgi:hypothetical protein
LKAKALCSYSEKAEVSPKILCSYLERAEFDKYMEMKQFTFKQPMNQGRNKKGTLKFS